MTMPDRERLMQALECIHNGGKGDCERRECQYGFCGFAPCNVAEIAGDALEVLKEQEAKAGHWIVLEFCANEGIYCSECHMKIFDRTTKPKQKLSQYCPHCGSRNEQFFRDGEVVFR